MCLQWLVSSGCWVLTCWLSQSISRHINPCNNTKDVHLRRILKYFAPKDRCLIMFGVWLRHVYLITKMQWKAQLRNQGFMLMSHEKARASWVSTYSSIIPFIHNGWIDIDITKIKHMRSLNWGKGLCPSNKSKLKMARASYRS